MCCCLLVWCNVLENKPSWIILKQNWNSWEMVFQPIWSFNSPKCVSSLSGQCCSPWYQPSVPSCPHPTACHHVPTIMPSTSVCLSNPTPCLHWAIVSWKPSRHPWSLCPCSLFPHPLPSGADGQAFCFQTPSGSYWLQKIQVHLNRLSWITSGASKI